MLFIAILPRFSTILIKLQLIFSGFFQVPVEVGEHFTGVPKIASHSNLKPALKSYAEFHHFSVYSDHKYPLCLDN